LVTAAAGAPDAPLLEVDVVDEDALVVEEDVEVEDEVVVALLGRLGELPCPQAASVVPRSALAVRPARRDVRRMMHSPRGRCP